MGLSHFNRYQISEHAKVRYFERIDSTSTEVKMLKDFRTFLQDATFLAKEDKNCESWFYSKKNYVIIIDPAKYRVITIYNSIKQKDAIEKEDKLKYSMQEFGKALVKTLEKPTRDENSISEVKTIMSEFAKESILKATRKHYEQMSVLYAEYAERMGKLAKTTKPDMFDKKRNELAELNAQINETEFEHQSIIQEFNAYVGNGLVTPN